MKIIDLSVSIVDGLPVDRAVQIPKIRYRRHTDEESVSTFLAAYPGLTGSSAWMATAGPSNRSSCPPTPAPMWTRPITTTPP